MHDHNIFILSDLFLFSHIYILFLSLFIISTHTHTYMETHKHIHTVHPSYTRITKSEEVYIQEQSLINALSETDLQ